MENEQDNILNPQPIGNNGDNGNELKLLNPKGAGRKPIEEDTELQAKYMRIWLMRVILRASNPEIAKAVDMSISGVKYAMRWARDHQELLSPDDSIKEAVVIIDEEIKECIQELRELKQGSIVFFPNSNIPVTRMVDGKEVVERKVDKNQINTVRRRKFDYQKLLFDLRIGTYGKATQIFANKAVINQGEMNIHSNGKVPLIIDKMTPEDKLTFIGLLRKYGRPPA